MMTGSLTSAEVINLVVADNNITLTIKLYGVFRINRFKEQQLEFAAGCNVDAIVAELGLNRQLLGIVLINGRHADVTAALADGDTLALLPILEGG